MKVFSKLSKFFVPQPPEPPVFDDTVDNQLELFVCVPLETFNSSIKYLQFQTRFVDQLIKENTRLTKKSKKEIESKLTDLLQRLNYLDDNIDGDIRELPIYLTQEEIDDV